MAEDPADAAEQKARHATRGALGEWRRRLWAHPELSPGDKLFGTILVDEFFNIESGQTNPSLAKMAAMMGEGIRGAKKHADAGRRTNLLGWKSGSGRTSSWYFLLDGHGTLIPGSLERLGKAKAGQRGTGVPANRAHPGMNGPVSVEQGGCLYGTSVPPNLKNQELNLSAEFQQLLQEVGPERWRPHLFEGATMRAPKIIVFRTAGRLDFALRHYGPDFERLGYRAMSQSQVNGELAGASP
jgi:hypothetical protein